MRPGHLPDYDNPPLDEVVVGVQFSPIPGYTSVHAKDIWNLFEREGFPHVQEQPALEPSFETFGGSKPQVPQIRFGPAPLRSRLWFISGDGDHLIQFQEDRLLLNWRRRPGGSDYPRFEGIADAFQRYLEILQDHCKQTYGVDLDVNQSEVSYINIVPVEAYSEAERWFRFWKLESIDIENLSLVFNEMVTDDHNKPYARLNHELNSVVTTDGNRRAFRLSLNYRGQPRGNTISDAMSFIRDGRESIVMRFSEFNTDRAAEVWGRQQ